MIVKYPAFLRTEFKVGTVPLALTFIKRCQNQKLIFFTPVFFVAFEVRSRTQHLICVGYSLHYWVSCAINKEDFFEIAFVVVVDSRLPRFEALAYVFPHFDELTDVVIRASSTFIIQAFAEVCYSVFVKRSSFKSLLNLR